MGEAVVTRRTNSSNTADSAGTLMTGSGKSIFSRMMGSSFTHRVSPVVVSCQRFIADFMTQISIGRDRTVDGCEQREPRPREAQAFLPLAYDTRVPREISPVSFFPNKITRDFKCLLEGTPFRLSKL